MKRTAFYLFAIVVLSTFAWSCSKDATSSSQASLQQSLNSSVQAVGLAVDAIENSAGYKVLSLGATSSQKSDSAKQITITIDSLRGIYEYKPQVVRRDYFHAYYRFFNKTSSNTDFIIKLPAPKVNTAGELSKFLPKDTALKNNFVISVSDYYFNYNPFVSASYRLASSVTVSDTAAGNVNIVANSTTSGYTYTASYAFGNGYTAQAQTISGDSITSINSILSGSSVVFQEKVIRLRKTSSSASEKQYILTIGNVQVKRFNKDSVQVYVGGVLQTKAVVKILDGTKAKVHGRQTHRDSDTPGIGFNRDIQITFDDGTTTTISALAGTAIDNATAVFASLQQINFATNVVDWIASDIFFKKLH